MEEMVLISTKANGEQVFSSDDEVIQKLTINVDGMVLFQSYYQFDYDTNNSSQLARIIHKKISSKQCERLFYVVKQIFSNYISDSINPHNQSAWKIYLKEGQTSHIYTGLLDGAMNYQGKPLTLILQHILGIEHLMAFGPIKSLKGNRLVETSDTNIIYLPNHDSLNQEIKVLKECVLSLTLKRDHQLYVENKIVEIRYTLELGPAEYRAVQAAMQLERIIKKYTLIQEQKVNGERISLPKIDEQIDQSYAYQNQFLAHKLQLLNQAIIFQREYGIENFVDQVALLDELYGKISNRIHPDLFPNMTSEVQDLYQNALIAYHQGDVFTLKMIATIVSNQNNELHNNASFATLFAEQKRLIALKDLINAELVQLDDEYPSILKKYIGKQEKVTNQRNFLNDQADESIKAIQDYQEKIDTLLK